MKSTERTMALANVQIKIEEISERIFELQQERDHLYRQRRDLENKIVRHEIAEQVNGSSVDDD